MKSLMIISILLALAVTGFSQSIWYVDDDNTGGPWLGTKDYPFYFIQGDNIMPGGIYKASDGDTVLVAPGHYTDCDYIGGSINFKGKKIIVRSDYDFDSDTYDTCPEITVIDGFQKGSVVVFDKWEGPDSVLDGFTIENGVGTTDYASKKCGGGICCGLEDYYPSSPTIKNNIIEENYAFWGAGIYIYRSSPEITGNSITNNNDEDDYGFGGGGIFAIVEDDLTIKNNRIIGNYSNRGAGICALCLDDSSTTICNNILAFNRAVGVIWPCYVSWGGGIFFQTDYSSDVTVRNCTISHNISEFDGGGIACAYGHEAIEIVNTIVYDNDALYSMPEIYIFTGNPNPMVTYCDIKGGWPGKGNIDADPLFVDPSKGDFHLTYPSPCKDAGDNSVVNEITDFEGDPRDANGYDDFTGYVDMGADEFFIHHYYIGAATPGGNITLNFVGLPNTSPVGYWISSGILKKPIKTKYGDWWNLWWLDFSTLIGPFLLKPIPQDGVEKLSGPIPMGTVDPYAIYLQAMIGDSLTNLCSIIVD